MSKVSFMGLRLADEPNVLHHENGWVDVMFCIGLDPELMDWLHQHDMTPQQFVLDFLSDSIDCFKIYLSMNDTDEDKSNV